MNRLIASRVYSILLAGLVVTGAQACPVPGQVEGLTMRLPWTAGQTYTAGYGYCADHHSGYQVDFSMPEGTPILAVAAGTVVQIGDNAQNGCTGDGVLDGGIFVKIQHTASGGTRYNSAYLHLSQRLVGCGDDVQSGQLIGYSGDTGCSSGAHLHFHIRRANASSCPTPSIVEHVRPVPMAGRPAGTTLDVISDFVEGQAYTAIDPETVPDSCDDALFVDDFNRPDGAIGNGWQSTTGNTGGAEPVLQDGKLTITTSHGGHAGVYRPVDTALFVTVTATLTHTNGFGGLPNRYASSFRYGSTGELESGYTLGFYRADSNYNNSSVSLGLDGVTLASAPSSFQFGASIVPTVTFAPDGSVTGSITGAGNTFYFSFPPRKVQLPGNNLAVVLGGMDLRSSVLIPPTLDDIRIEDRCSKSRLVVIAEDAFHSEGYQYGPFNPASRTYRLLNVGESDLDWTASQKEPWFQLSATGGTIEAGKEVGLTASVNQALAASFTMPGTYEDVLALSNTTNGRGNTTRTLRLVVKPTQPVPDQSVPSTTITLDHLWEWSDADGRFKKPVGGVTIDPTQPTYLLTHGWDGTLDGVGVGIPCRSPSYAVSSIACAIREVEPDANVLAWEWHAGANPNRRCDFPDGAIDDLEGLIEFVQQTPTLILRTVARASAIGIGFPAIIVEIVRDARRSGLNTAQEGAKLGEALAGILRDGDSLGSEIHLIGKSHGGGVLGAAATRLSQLGFPVDSLTTLDTPRWKCIPGFCIPLAGCQPERCIVNSLRNVNPAAVAPSGQASAFHYEDARLGFGAPVRGTHPNLTNIALNKDFVPSIEDVGTSPQVIAHLWIAGEDSGECLSNDGWYPQAVRSSNIRFDGGAPLASILSVLDFPSGCYAEQSMFQFTSTGCESVAVAGEPVIEIESVYSLIAYEPFDTAASWSGNLAELVVEVDPNDQTNRVILMEELGDASFFKDIDWPEDAIELSFEYMFREPRGEENLTVYLGDEIVYYDSAAITLARDELTASGVIYVGDVAGTTARLNFVLRTDEPDGGEFGGSLIIDNIRVYGFRAGDADLDGDRDLFDFSVLQRCAGRGTNENDELPPECWAFAVDENPGVGLEDFTAFLDIIDDESLGGPIVTPVP